MLRDPKSFTDNMRLVAQVLYENGGEMTPTQIGQSMFPKMGGQQLTGPLRALRVGGWAARRKEKVGVAYVGYRGFPVIHRWYRLTDEGRRAWSDYLIESRMIRRRSEKRECEHSWINHYSVENGDLPDARLCLECGEFEQTERFGRPTRFPDLHEQLTSQTLDTLSAIRRAPWRERAVESLKRGLARLITFKVRK